ncbi:MULTISPECIES: GLPGLI family protein [Chryseobacterium]|uniref:GLPGLI family protein n=1 Tax=Chryseobacterium camelliae TaxID=1265445 RepID=A0ABU0TEJ1_9FLAO|nr:MULTISPECIES: GLPGLI family protein [Chryseobacterium]MDT3406715.1 GLPGLI family protein [Pseudacidovorax intermedius]MDQ1095488.1 GLPGLI family protein [Chryseobacterium camelliae]MDQ1099425.1 GLPGLI family protein [Chryseobacterium sp. SORGH_AS_1048]MDR6086771.1 GLPGLI family protein [Chryseobacterium sp. SORGH_AS_0909]MDR6131144.1 GLPGLI family protein [Chryseobacterium sp. SORGH_AS_1175]
MKLLLNTLMAFFCFSFIQAQVNKDSSDIEVRYNFTFIQDTLDSSSALSEPMVLLTNGKQSIYYSENYKAAVDGFGRKLKDAVKKGDIVEPGTLPRSKVRHNVYKDRDHTYISNYLGQNYYTFESPDQMKWEIDHQKTAVIGGYTCHEATISTGGKNFSAWFTYDIPISDGPYKFRGLPGLILQLSETNNYIRFDLISIHKKKVPIEPKKGILISKEQYLSKRKEYMNDPYQGKINNPEYRKIAEENKKKYNNALE